MTQDMITLGFDRIIEQLCAHAVSGAAKEKLKQTSPILNESLCRARMEETTAARDVLEGAGNPPLAEMNGLEDALTQAVQGAMLAPEQLAFISRFAATIRRMRRYLQNAVLFSPGIASWQTKLPNLDALSDSIDRAIREDTVLDDASTALRDLRRRRERMEQAIREKLNQVLAHHKQQLADAFVTQRGGHFTVPVQRRFQSAFPGRVIEASAKGATVFMEPNAVAAMQQELDGLLVEIDAEERRILWELSDLAASEEPALRRAIRAMADLDAIFARAKLSAAMHAGPVELTAERRLVLKNARHPLLDPAQCVPLDFDLAVPDLMVAVTGPNTGGKTVCLKTVGLLSLMAQSGLHIPCGEGSVIGLMDQVLCDIGDSQSISQNLSTFSGHMTNVLRILSLCSRDSLVLLDELGSGTDPAEGTGLATAILEELLRRNCFILVTTHDPQIKRWAAKTEHVVSARMAFDRESLRPLYRLEMGRSGESCAIEIARRLGMPGHLLDRAREVSLQGPEAESRVKLPVKAFAAASRLKRTETAREADFERFTMGDSVEYLPEHKTAIVYQPADEQGNVVIQLQGRKMTVRHNRLKLLVPATELYPPDYDFSIIFDTVANRKAAHQMERKFAPDALVVHKEGSAPEEK